MTPSHSKIKPIVQGHRGARARFPENTLSAFNYAIINQIPVIELDIHTTKDKKLIIHHDPFFIKNNKKFYIYSSTLKQIQSTIVEPNPLFPRQNKTIKEPPPSLEGFFNWLHHHPHPFASQMILNIEVKSIPALEGKLYPTPAWISKTLYALLEKYNLIHRCWIQSFDHRVLKHIRKQNSDLKISLLLSQNYLNASLLLKDLHAQAVSVPVSWVDKALCRSIHKVKGQVFAWTANTKKEWVYLTECQVDGIITDDPVRCKNFLKNL
ncbi:MAG: hypothetical protein D6797_03125 [Bdellovibrio sp.]|nr:MAG: hypothetical protein D6797_03125 [Bdellovibrio sp.]